MSPLRQTQKPLGSCFRLFVRRASVLLLGLRQPFGLSLFGRAHRSLLVLLRPRAPRADALPRLATGTPRDLPEKSELNASFNVFLNFRRRLI
jgi:hypothetical protein